MTRIIDLTGQRFGRLVVIERCRGQVGDRRTLWSCRCACGTLVIHASQKLIRGENRASCGCVRRISVGDRYGRLVVVGPPDNVVPARSRWPCRCDCGEIQQVTERALIRGSTRSCGCLQRESARNRKIHGRAGTMEYRVWRAMLDRCTNPRSQSYADYGGRGITVCDRWQTLDDFIADMGDRPDGMSIERIDNDGPYSPDNCRWATNTEQHRNTRRTKRLTFRNETRCLVEWAQITGINRTTISQRLAKGLSIEDALTQPVGPTGRKPTQIATLRSQCDADEAA